MDHTVVVGGGIAGLVAASRLVQAGHAVTLLEASPKLGGLVRTVEAWGRPVDLGAESLFLAAPGLARLLTQLGLDAELVAAAARPTWIALDGRLRRLPEGVGPGGPTRLWPVARSGVLSPRGLVRAGLDTILPSARADDVSVGSFVRQRFGDEVADRLVAPLLGNLHAGSIDRISLASALPQLHRTAQEHRSVLLASARSRRSTSGRRTRPGSRGASGRRSADGQRGADARRHGRASGAGSAPRPTFVTPRTGLNALTDALVDQLGDATVRLGARVDRIRPRTDGPSQRNLLPRTSETTATAGWRYEVVADGGEVLRADSVVVATPARAAARLLAPVDAAAGGALDGLAAASVAVAVLAYPPDAMAGVPAFDGTGVLVAPDDARLLKAATFLSSKWGHLAGEPFLVRASAGRYGDARIDALDDDELVARLHHDLATLTGVAAPPVGAVVQRWPEAMPQLEVGHRERMAAIADRLQFHPGVVVAGAGYDGVGISAAVRSGEAAAARLMESSA